MPDQIEVGELVADVFLLGDGLQDLDAFGGDFRAGAVSADDGDFVSFGHGWGLSVIQLGLFNHGDTEGTEKKRLRSSCVLLRCLGWLCLCGFDYMGDWESRILTDGGGVM